jgi:hypothetical protein
MYLAVIILLNQLAYAATNSQPSSSNWVSTAPNPKILQLVCNWNNHLQMGHLKMGAYESLAFNS